MAGFLPAFPEAGGETLLYSGGGNGRGRGRMVAGGWRRWVASVSGVGGWRRRRA